MIATRRGEGGNDNAANALNYETCLNAAMLHKCMMCRLWHDSPHILKQFERIGDSISQHFVDADVCAFAHVLALDARTIEAIAKRPQPFGRTVIDTVQKLPRFALAFESANAASGDFSGGEVTVRVRMENFAQLIELENRGTLGPQQPMIIVVGDEKNRLLVFDKIKGEISKQLKLDAKKSGLSVHVSLILLGFVGLDVHESFKWKEPDAINAINNQESMVEDNEYEADFRRPQSKKNDEMQQLSSLSSIQQKQQALQSLSDVQKSVVVLSKLQPQPQLPKRKLSDSTIVSDKRPKVSSQFFDYSKYKELDAAAAVAVTNTPVASISSSSRSQSLTNRLPNQTDMLVSCSTFEAPQSENNAEAAKRKFTFRKPDTYATNVVKNKENSSLNSSKFLDIASNRDEASEISKILKPKVGNNQMENKVSGSKEAKKEVAFSSDTNNNKVNNTTFKWATIAPKTITELQYSPKNVYKRSDATYDVNLSTTTSTEQTQTKDERNASLLKASQYFDYSKFNGKNQVTKNVATNKNEDLDSVRIADLEKSNKPVTVSNDRKATMRDLRNDGQTHTRKTTISSSLSRYAPPQSQLSFVKTSSSITAATATATATAAATSRSSTLTSPYWSSNRNSTSMPPPIRREYANYCDRAFQNEIYETSKKPPLMLSRQTVSVAANKMTTTVIPMKPQPMTMMMAKDLGGYGLDVDDHSDHNDYEEEKEDLDEYGIIDENGENNHDQDDYANDDVDKEAVDTDNRHRERVFNDYFGINQREHLISTRRENEFYEKEPQNETFKFQIQNQNNQINDVCDLYDDYNDDPLDEASAAAGMASNYDSRCKYSYAYTSAAADRSLQSNWFSMAAIESKTIQQQQQQQHSPRSGKIPMSTSTSVQVTTNPYKKSPSPRQMRIEEFFIPQRRASNKFGFLTAAASKAESSTNKSSPPPLLNVKKQETPPKKPAFLAKKQMNRELENLQQNTAEFLAWEKNSKNPLQPEQPQAYKKNNNENVATPEPSYSPLEEEPKSAESPTQKMLNRSQRYVLLQDDL